MLDEATGNHEAARLLQTALRRREHNVQPQIRSDREVSEQELRNADKSSTLRTPDSL